MPGWVITLISVAASALVSGIVGFLVKRALDKYFKKKDAEAEEKEKKLAEAEKILEEKKQKVLQETIDNSVKKYTQPIDDTLKNLDERVAKIQNGTLDTLRDRILSAYYKCLEKGYRSQYDYENVHHMYDDYTDLHGNSFVEDCMAKLDALPSEEEYKRLNKSKLKKKKEDDEKDGE